MWIALRGDFSLYAGGLLLADSTHFYSFNNCPLSRILKIYQVFRIVRHVSIAEIR